MEREHRASTGGCRARGRWRFPGAGYLRESVRRYDGALRQGGPTPASGKSVTHSLPLPIPPCGGRLSRTAATIASVDVEFASLMFAVIAAGIALAMQRRADMKLINSRFDDTNRRIDDTNKGIDDTTKGLTTPTKGSTTRTGGLTTPTKGSTTRTGGLTTPTKGSTTRTGGSKSSSTTRTGGSMHSRVGSGRTVPNWSHSGSTWRSWWAAWTRWREWYPPRFRLSSELW